MLWRGNVMSTTDIKFGTDGWRGILSDDFIYDNVALVCHAIDEYLHEEGNADGKLLIGYDRRFAAESFAAHAAAAFKLKGRDVLVIDEPSPTPVVAFGVRHLGLAGAVQFTASHNPHYYQGIKFIPDFAGPAMPSTTNRITDIIQEQSGSYSAPELTMEWDGEVIELKEHYFDHLGKLINTHSLSNAKWKVLYNPMHGVGAHYLDEFLRRAGVEVETINSKRDVLFGHTLPDPSPANLEPLASLLVEKDCQILIANDGDADRFGFLNSAGRYFGANHALPMLADYLVRFRQMKGSLVRTVSTSHLLDDIAKEHGLELKETAVGFKYVGAEMRKGALVGGEESGGFSMQGHIPEKDGILASLLMLEMGATRAESFETIYQELLAQYSPRAFQRIDRELPEEQKSKLLSALQNYEESSFAGKEIESVITIDGVKFILDDGSWVLVRPSGTEPLVRIYLETTKVEGFKRWKAQVSEAINQLATKG